MHTYVNTYLTYLHIFLRKYKHIYTYILIHIRNIRKNTYIPSIHTYIYAYTHTYHTYIHTGTREEEGKDKKTENVSRSCEYDSKAVSNLPVEARILAAKG